MAQLIVLPRYEEAADHEAKQRMLQAAVACAAASLAAIRQLLAEGATFDCGMLQNLPDVRPILGLTYKILTGQDWC